MKCLDNLRLTHGVRGKRDENSEGKKRDEKKSEKEGNDIEENILCGDAVKSEGKLLLSVGSFESLRGMCK